MPVCLSKVASKRLLGQQRVPPHLEGFDREVRRRVGSACALAGFRRFGDARRPGVRLGRLHQTAWNRVGFASHQNVARGSTVNMEHDHPIGDLFRGNRDADVGVAATPVVRLEFRRRRGQSRPNSAAPPCAARIAPPRYSKAAPDSPPPHTGSPHSTFRSCQPPTPSDRLPVSQSRRQHCARRHVCIAGRRIGTPVDSSMTYWWTIR